MLSLDFSFGFFDISLVGLCAVLVSFASFFDSHKDHQDVDKIHNAALYVGILVGSITFSGSLVAFLKLRGWMRSAPILLPGRHWITGLLTITLSLGLVLFTVSPGDGRSGFINGLLTLSIAATLSLYSGVHLSWAVGSGDMPV